MEKIYDAHIGVKLLNENAKLPTQATAGSAGFDVYSSMNTVIYPGETALVKTGIAMDIPEGYCVEVCSRSGLALKNGVFVLNSPGIVDSDYKGEVGVILHNSGKTPFEISIGDRVAQLLVKRAPIIKMYCTENIGESSRGEGGFGSTGV